ncbi:Bgt-3135 [Blumeria graminis f. sp. tritici]|uniref:Bgt-3135 n=1 Tax=Blumeria graminis f. sp. tritici TaxID=62690 RepID=A0A9X9L839_BLUGR|nr:Bgt-3135 [Blumeria graminis f. sp. tritici]
MSKTTIKSKQNASWPKLYPVVTLLSLIAGIYIFVPIGTFSLRTTFLSPQTEQVQRLPTQFEQLHQSSSNEAKEVLAETLRLLHELLTEINSDNDDSNALTTNKKSNSLMPRGIVSEISGILQGAVTGALSGELEDSIGDAAKFLGMGLGGGAVTGLLNSTMGGAALKKMAPATTKATGLNLVAQNLGEGLSSSVVGSVNISALAPAAPSVDTLLPASRALAQGIGSGAASGLKLKAVDPNAFNNTGIPGVAGSFGQGLTMSFLGGIDFKKAAAMMAPNVSSVQLNSAALSLAQGLGSGAAFGVKLTTKPPSNTSFNTDGINGVAGSVGQGLTTSFLQDIDFNQLKMMAATMAPNISSEQINTAALSLAQGLGSGAAFGAKLSTTPPAPNTFNTDGINGVAGNIGQGLTTSFLQEVDINQLKMMAATMAPQLTSAQINTAALSLAQGLGSGAAYGANLSATPPPNNTFNTDGINGVAGNVGQGLTTSFLKGVDINQLKMMAATMAPQLTSAQINTAALSLAQGLGSGAAFGAKLSTKPPSNTTFNTDGINGIAGNVGQGLTTSFIQEVDLNQLKMMAATMAPQLTQEQINTAALSLAQGLGSGAAFGAKLSTKPPSNTTFNTDGINGIAGNVGQGLTTSFIQEVDLNQLKMMAASMAPQLTPAQINTAALSLAQGLGSGAAFGAKLTTTLPNNSFNSDGINGIAGNVGQGLSASFIKDIDFKALAGSGPGIPRQQILEAAQGLGSGLAEGAVVGVGLQPDTSMTNPKMDTGGMGEITENFGRGLTQSFLSNGTLFKAMALLMQQPKTGPQLNVMAVAKGFAMGLVDGAQTSVDNAGGLGSVLKMSPQVSNEMSGNSMNMTGFDDSVGGAAMGFGSGLGLEATRGVLQALGKPPMNVPAMSNAASNPSGSTAGAAPESSPAMPSNMTAVKLRRRQDATITASSISANLTANGPVFDLTNLNETINPLLQKGSNIIGCQGIGGLAAVAISAFLNAYFRGQIQLSTLQNSANSQTTAKIAALINQTFQFTDSSGNNFVINIKEMLVLVNGNSLQKEIVVLVGHSKFPQKTISSKI